MKKLIKCPICGKLNNEEYETMDMWGAIDICEDYYDCDKCGYWRRMCYSDVYEGIDLHSIKQLKLLIKNYKRAKNYKIERCPC